MAATIRVACPLCSTRVECPVTLTHRQLTSEVDPGPLLAHVEKEHSR